MFDTAETTIDHAYERRRASRERRLAELADEEARRTREVTAIIRAADDEGDWRAAGCSSSAQWFAQVYRSGFQTAKRVTETSEALRSLPALDRALGRGALTLDQVVAATPFATPATDAEIARTAIGKAPTEIAAAARRLVPPKVADDQAIRARRALRMTWSDDARELIFNGRLPLEQGVVFEQTIRTLAKERRGEDKKTGEVLEWQHYTADALVTLARAPGGADDGIRRSSTTVIVHLSPDEPPFIEGAGTISPETAEYLCCDARSMFIQPHGRDLRHSRIGRCASYAQMRALVKRSKHCQYPGCTSTHEMQGHHLLDEAKGGIAELENLLLLCSRHHRHLHVNHIRAGGPARAPTFTDAAGRAITAYAPHAPPG